MIKRILPALILLLAVAGALFWWRRVGAAAVSTPTFRAAVVQRGDVTVTVTASGTLSALTTVDVGSQVSGQITKLYADFNDTVKEGQLIAEVDPSTYEARLFQAEANLQSVQASLELRRLNLQRSADLLAKRLVAQSDYDQVAVDLRQQEAAAKNSEAAVKSARLDLDRCKIYSPIDGVVLKRAVDVGQTVQSNFSVATLFTIARDLRQMEISATVSEADIGTVEAGQSVSFTVDAFSTRKFQGKVRQVRNNSVVASNVVTYPVIVTVANEDLKLRPGMTANIVIATTKRTNVLRVPNSAMRFKPPEAATILAAAAGGAAPGGGPSLDQMPEGIRKQMLAEFDKNGDGKLDDDERKTMQTTLRSRFAAMAQNGGGPPMGGGMGGGPGRGGFGPPGGGMGSAPVTVYLLAEGQPNAAGFATGPLKPTVVTTGVSDSAFTEIISGLKDGDVIVTGNVSTPAAAPAGAGSNNIFGPQRPPGMGGKK